MNRRNFVKQGSIASASLVLAPAFGSVIPKSVGADPALSLHVFSKHLQFLDYTHMAEAAADIGFDGIDLTVRKKGHVLPERAVDDLPKAVDAIHAAGLLADMMVTNVDNATDATHRQVLRTAASLGIKWYRLGYVNFDEQQTIPARLKELNKQMKKLAKYNRSLGIIGAYQNHAGHRVGAAIWDIWHLLAKLNPDVMGCQYDIRHAIVEGGNSWRTGLKLIRPKINCIVLKDFVWKKVEGKWKVVNVPLGEGMVDFDAYFKLLKTYQINVPVSIHYEYDLGGAEHGATEVSAADRKKVFKAMKQDLEFARMKWEEA